MRGLLASSTAQTALTSFLVSEAQTKGYIGWQFDFEHIASSDRDLFSAFVIKAAAALHAHGLILSIAVVAQAPVFCKFGYVEFFLQELEWCV